MYSYMILHFTFSSYLSFSLYSKAEHFTKRFSTLLNNPQDGSASYNYVSSHAFPISHKTSSCSQDNLVALNKKGFTSRNILSSAFSKIFLSKKSSKATEHHITMPTTYKQNTTFGFPTLQYKEAVSSCPDFSKRFQRTGDTAKLSSSADMLHSDPETTVMIRTEKPLPPIQPNGIYQLSTQPNSRKLHFRSTMPLPLTPLDLAITTDSASTTSSYTNSAGMNSSISSSRSSSSISSAGMQESSKADSSSVTQSDNHSDAQVKKRKHDYESVDVDFESILSLLFNSSTTAAVDGETDDGKDLVPSDKFGKIKQDDGERNASGSKDIMTSKTSVNIESLPSTAASTSSDTKANTWFDEDKDYVISDYEFFKGVRQLQQASANYSTITSADRELSCHHRTHGSEQLCIQQYGENDMSQKEDEYSAQTGTNIYDKINLECVTHTDQCTCEQYDASDMGDYIFMHATTCPHLGTASQTYDYVDQLYITMLRQNYKKYASGVPPRKVNRPGCKPLVDISACPNATKMHDATYVNCSNLRRKCGTALLPPRQYHTNNMDTSSVPAALTPPRNIPRLGHYLSAPPAAPTT